MNDMSSVIEPKSDQINADTLLSGPVTVTIKDVRISGGQEQPVTIVLEETNLFYRPCKSMSRCLVAAWGPDASKYIGRSLTLYRDPTVKWAGMEVGGIRISHMSHIDGEKLMMLTATKGSRKPHKVKPLAVEREEQPDDAAIWADKFIANVGRAPDVEKLDGYVSKVKANLVKLEQERPELHARCDAAIDARRSELTGDDDDPFGETETPDPAAKRLTDLRTRIESATAADELDEVSNEWAKHRVAYDDETIAEVDDLVSAAFKRVRGGEGK